MVSEYAYAKVNLALYVGDTLPTGYHEVKNIMVPVDLYDSLTFEVLNKEIILLDNTKIDVEKNLVYKAAKLFIDTYNIKSGVLINLDKKIPSEAGLAGGSSDAAATLRGLNRLFNLDKTLDELAQLGAQLGSDVPYCVYQKACLCVGTGTECKLLDVSYDKWPILLVKPPFGCSTKDIYKTFDPNKESLESRIDKVIEALKENDLEKLNQNMFNDLETPAFEIVKELKKIKSIMSESVHTMMSGSGSTLFSISKDVEVLEELKKKLSKYNFVCLTKLL
jgi:4-diphosphocytidyl-2-C-methyl-D-erythritol kinase